ncbi:M23 family metallopeptidase [Lederbergia lenta]|uniref:M23 family metallopeptidase n=1 Tax=Lederbergia lenta TaxID=1467 RepID=UPI00203E1FA2|nr:M23 family metallopeptidase [Lederbergia lenta]MCM3110012.1 M23 family metallopeptidase [Lederbergia lenta]
MGYEITSQFRSQESFRNSPHLGIDFKMEKGTELRSIFEGKILKTVDYGSENLGKGVFVQWKDGKTAIYGHMSNISVQQGQFVKVGDLLGYSGNSGNVVGVNGGYHLHFGLKNGEGEFTDPSPYISKIQAMNDGVQQLASEGVNFMGYFQQHLDALTDLLNQTKINLIHFVSSTDYFPFIQLFKNTVKLFFFDL